MKKINETVAIAVRDLRIHPDAQREIVPSKLKKLIAEMDLDLIGAIHVVRATINGLRGLWAVDGQHRILALVELGFGDWILDVYVHDGEAGVAYACRLFLGLNDNAKVVRLEKFDKQVKSGATAPNHIASILASRGISVARGSGPDRICCISSLLSMYSRDAGKSMELAIDTAIQAWGRSASALEGKLLDGIALVYHTYGSAIDRPAFVKKLAKYQGGASRIIGGARTLREMKKGSITRSVGEVLVGAYNSGRNSGRLDPL